MFYIVRYMSDIFTTVTTCHSICSSAVNLEKSFLSSVSVTRISLGHYVSLSMQNFYQQEKKIKKRFYYFEAKEQSTGSSKGHRSKVV